MIIGRCYTFICQRFVYWGRLAGVSDESYWLTDAYIVYETGPWKDDEWQTCEKLPTDWFIPKVAVDSFGIGKSPSSVKTKDFPAESEDAITHEQLAKIFLGHP